WSLTQTMVERPGPTRLQAAEVERPQVTTATSRMSAGPLVGISARPRLTTLAASASLCEYNEKAADRSPRVRKPEGKRFAFPSAICLLLIFWLLDSGFCLLLSNDIVTALCQAGILGG